MIGRFFILSLRNIRHRSVRSWLTILGIIVGVALIVSLVSLGRGLENAISQMMRTFGADLVTILPGEETDALLGVLGGGQIRDKDVDLLDDVPGVNLVIPFDIAFFPLEFDGEVKSTTVHASEIRKMKKIFIENRGVSFAAGEWPDREDSSQVVLGYKLATKKFREEVFIGDEIRIKGKRFRVTGILNEIGNSEDDNAIYMSLTNLRKISGRKGSVRMVMARTDQGADQNAIAEDIKFKLKSTRGSADYTVLTSEKTEQIVGDVIGIIQISVLFLAIFSIIVGAIGVMNTMYTSVLERRREIGILKALGATKNNIVSIFVIESGVIGVIGGVVGTLAGLGLGKVAEYGAMASGFKFLKVYVSVEFVLVVLVSAFVLGAVSGLLPALQAAKMSPADALRYE